MSTVVSDIMPILESVGYISVAVRVRLTSVSLTWLTPKAIALGVLMAGDGQNNSHGDLQDHSMPPILVPMESPYIRICDFLLVSNTILQCMFYLALVQVIADYWSIICCRREMPLMHSFRVNIYCKSQKAKFCK